MSGTFKAATAHILKKKSDCPLLQCKLNKLFLELPSQIDLC